MLYSAYNHKREGDFMKKIDSLGFAHLLLIIIGSVLLIGVVGFAGYRVINANFSDTNTSTADKSLADSQKNIDTTISRAQEISTQGSAATETQPGANVEKKTTIETTYDISAAYGSLKQVEKSLKAGDFSDVLWFVTPRMMFQFNKALTGNMDVRATYQDCQGNSLCVLGLKSTNITTNYTTRNFDYQYSDAPGKSLVFQLKDVNSAAALLYGNGEVVVDMLDIGDNWVIERVTVNGSSI